MSWSLYRWVWQLEAPLFIGMPPAGSLNRSRLYVPARAIWGAITTELAHHQANHFPDYQDVGERVRKNARFTYLYPAEQANGSWLAWLPDYARSNGLSWHREASAGSANGSVPDRQFRRWLLDAHPATAIDPESDSAKEGSLRETECLMANWRSGSPGPRGPVGLVGYVFLLPELEDGINPIGTLSLGGDTRYGLGRVRLVEWQSATDVFGSSVELIGKDPEIISATAFGHSKLNGDGRDVQGALERIAGWDRSGERGLEAVENTPLWVPGTTTNVSTKPPCWGLTAAGLWKAAT